MQIDTDFEGGNVIVLDAAAPGAISVALRYDTNATFRQSFSFKVRGVKGEPCKVRVENAGESTFPEGWHGYRVCASEDGRDWFRVPTVYDGRTLVFSYAPSSDVVHFAYSMTYPAERRERLLSAAARRPGFGVEVVGTSVEGRPLHLLTVGDRGPGRPRVWIIARQHPDEAMAEWFMEGVVERLLDEGDPVARDLRARCVLYLVNSMNPDGSAHGNIRANAAGADLNRAWLDPSPYESPEVLGVRAAIERAGADLFLDIHGDERIPHCFAAGCEGNPGYTARLRRLERRFVDDLIARGEFQRERGYPLDPPGLANLAQASNYVCERFGCLSLTIEMPFKDHDESPDRRKGWSPERAMALGATTLECVRTRLDDLR